MSPRRLLSAAAIAGAVLLLAGCSSGDSAPAPDTSSPQSQQTDDGVSRQAAHPDSIRQYTETLNPGIEGTIFVPTEADYERLEAALAEQLGCGEVMSWGDAGLQCPDGSEYAGAPRYMVRPTDDANLGHVFGTEGFVEFRGGYALLDTAGQPLGTGHSDPGGLYNPETGELRSLY